jgi:hypothetical protein
MNGIAVILNMTGSPIFNRSDASCGIQLASLSEVLRRQGFRVMRYDNPNLEELEAALACITGLPEHSKTVFVYCIGWVQRREDGLLICSRDWETGSDNISGCLHFTALLDTLALDVPGCLAVFVDPVASLPVPEHCSRDSAPLFAIPLCSTVLLSSVYDDIQPHGDPPTTYLLESLIRRLSHSHRPQEIEAVAFLGDVLNDIYDSSDRAQFGRMLHTVSSGDIILLPAHARGAEGTVNDAVSQLSAELAIGSDEDVGYAIHATSMDVIPVLGWYFRLQDSRKSR